MIERKATVRNEHGIHCRPSAAIVKALTGYPGSITLNAASGSCDPRSIIGLIALGLEPGAEVTVLVEGPDEEAEAKHVVDLLETQYDFPPRNEGENTQVLLDRMGVNPRKP